MNTQEVGRQTLLHAFHSKKHDDGARLSVYMHLQILRHALDVAYVGNLYAHHLMLRLQEDILVCLLRLRFSGERQRRIVVLIAFLYAQSGTTEVVQTERFEQIVYGVNLESVDSILRIGCGKDHKRRRHERAHKVHAVKVGHVDVDEDDVNAFVVDDVARFESTLTLAHERKERNLRHVDCKLLECQRLVVDDKSLYHSVWIL